MIDPSCTAERKCWEHYQPEARVMEADIQAALAAARTWSNTLHPKVSTQELQDLIAQYQHVIDLIGRQWREMVREPFDFASGVTITRTSHDRGKVTVERLTLDDIMGDL